MPRIKFLAMLHNKNYVS